jgi:hypothetical protein
MSYPTNTDINIAIGAPDGDGNPVHPTALANHTFGSADSHQFQFTLTTGAQNQVTGSGAVSAKIAGVPTGCAQKDPPTGHSDTQSFTIQ